MVLVSNSVDVGYCSGFNVISATCGNIKFVLCLMVAEMKAIVNTSVQSVAV